MNRCYIVPMLILMGCARGESDPLPSDERIVDAGTKEPVRHTQPDVLVCDVVKIDRIKDCTLYTLKCEDGSDQFAISCEIRPIGVITNPPRPI